jgi:ABC-type dipeptide/oligopeptide/nickel transport system ATPase component
MRVELSVQNLSVAAQTDRGLLPLVSDVSFDVASGSITALIGESGSGKSLTASAVLGLIDRSVYQVRADRLQIGSQRLEQFKEAAFRKIRGRLAGYVTQDPATALDPTMTVGDQIAEVFVTHQGMDWSAARREAVRMLELVRIPSAETRARDYPHSFSGGMRQRVVIAGAVAMSPPLLIADEPTTALDVTVQAGILALIDELRRSIGTSVLLITHDLGIVYQIAHEILVMHAGRIVERGEAEAICTSPAHAYTARLLAAVPDLGEVAHA